MPRSQKAPAGTGLGMQDGPRPVKATWKSEALGPLIEMLLIGSGESPALSACAKSCALLVPAACARNTIGSGENENDGPIAEVPARPIDCVPWLALLEM